MSDSTSSVGSEALKGALRVAGRTAAKAVWTAVAPYLAVPAAIVGVSMALLLAILGVLHGPGSTKKATLLAQARGAASSVVAVKSFDGAEKQFEPDATQLAVIAWDAQQAGQNLGVGSVAAGMAPRFTYGTQPSVLRVLKVSGAPVHQSVEQVPVVISAQTVQGDALLHYTESTQPSACPAKWQGFSCVRQVPQLASVSWSGNDSREVALFQRWFPGQDAQDMISMVQFEAQRWMGLDGVSLALPIFLGYGLRHAVLQWSAIFNRYATAAVPAPLLAAVAAQESGGNPNALSPAGAMGLMQVEPANTGLRAANLFDPAANVRAGSAFLNELASSYDLQPGCINALVTRPACQTALALTLAAYNAGPGSVAEYGGVPPFSQTVLYIRRVEGYLADFAAA